MGTTQVHEALIRGTTYRVGDRVELIKMGKDPDPIEDGSQGTIDWINVSQLGWQIGVLWDNGRRLMLVKQDKFRKIEPEAMKTANELADAASETYRTLKCTLDEGVDCATIMQVHDENGIQLVLLEDRSLVGGFARALQFKAGVTALVLNVEIYASSEDPLGQSLRDMFHAKSDSVKEALLTVAVTHDGQTAVRVFQYYNVKNGIQFEQASMHADAKLAELVYELKGAWNNTTTN